MTPAVKRRKAQRLVHSLHAQGNTRDAIINAIVSSCGISTRSALNIVSHSGLFDPIPRRESAYGIRQNEMAEQAWEGRSINIDTGTHPYYRAARILDAKPGISAEVREGICYRNGFPWPAMKFLAEAGVELAA